MIADNRLAELAEIDMPALKDLLETLDDGSFDMDLTGFDNSALEELMGETHEEGLTDEDEVPDAQESICEPGDLWVLGNHRLMCGDATVITHVEKLMGGEKADMVFTDPPYNENFSGGIDKEGNKSKKGANVTIIGDKKSKTEFKQFCVDILKIIKLSTKGAWYICFYRLMTDVWMEALRETSAEWKSIIIWKKIGQRSHH